MKFVKEIKQWSELWKERISQDPYCIDPAYWSNSAREYDRKILANGQLIGKLKKYVNRDSTVLDIGAGTGYLTLALAPFVKKVKALDPAEKMLNILREKAENLGIHNIDYLNRKWEDATTDEYDIVLASHSISCTKDPLTFFQRMHECARRFVFLIVYIDFDIMSMVDRKTPQPSYALLYNMLCCLEIYANVEIFKSYRRFFYTRKDDILRKMEGRINKDYIHRNLRETNGEFFLDIETDEVLIWYKKDNNFKN
jgi:ubiquinone/menaquinone biosynthesis C-methylase UbiE